MVPVLQLDSHDAVKSLPAGNGENRSPIAADGVGSHVLGPRRSPELNSVLGLARIDIVADLGDSIDLLQGHLVGLMGELAVLPEDAACYGESGHPSIGEDEVAMVESLVRDLEDGGVSFEGWARPGAKDNRTGARLDFARTVCRRAERRGLALGEEVSNDAIPVFLNRLSDLLWLLARHTEGGD